VTFKASRWCKSTGCLDQLYSSREAAVKLKYLQPCRAAVTQPRSHATQQSRTPAATHFLVQVWYFHILNTKFCIQHMKILQSYFAKALQPRKHSSHATQQLRNTAVPQPRSTHFKIRHTFSRVEYYQLYSTCEKAAIANQLDHRPTVFLLSGQFFLAIKN
jgi:hypothetical protein